MYPITHTDAKDFAAIQMQITYGDHDPLKHKPGFFDVNAFLPLQYRKDKKIQVEIFRDHKKLAGMSDMNAKYRYCQLVRSLKSYGITFFDCQEKQLKGKQSGNKKPTRVLIGITKEKIIKVDPETQRTITEWTFKQLRRWSFAHGNFTLDFGDYEEDYITVLTDEGEALAQLIGSYIVVVVSKNHKIRKISLSEDIAKNWPSAHHVLPSCLQHTICEILCVSKTILPKDIQKCIVQAIILLFMIKYPHYRLSTIKST